MFDFNELNQALAATGAPAGAAETHGILCGVLCASKKTAVEWQSLVLGENEANSDLTTLLKTVFELSNDWLTHGNSEFTLLLPEDTAPLIQRIEALATWCQGFLLGLTTTGINNPAILPGDASEIANDILAISQMESSTDHNQQTQQEKDLTELEEYVRVGVQLIYEELHAVIKDKGENSAGSTFLN